MKELLDDFLKHHNNPWKEVADLYQAKELNQDCLYGSQNEYVCSDDRLKIIEYNKNVYVAAENNPRKDELLKDIMITNIPAEPWGGNPFKAKLIILSLNPGYVPEVNNKLAKLLQSNAAIRKAIIEYKMDTLLFKTDYLLPPNDDIIQGCQISCKDAVNMLGDWYWHKMLRQLREDVASQLNENEFYKRVALVQYFGYSSQTASRTLPHIPSQDFTKEMLHYIAANHKDEICFLIMRSKKEWRSLLGEKFFDDYSDIIIFNDNPRCQYITEGNLGAKYADNIKKVFSK